jgi:hypothetical protein
MNGLTVNVERPDPEVQWWWGNSVVPDAFDLDVQLLQEGDGTFTLNVYETYEAWGFSILQIPDNNGCPTAGTYESGYWNDDVPPVWVVLARATIA